MKRRLFTILSVLSLLLFVAVVAVWFIHRERVEVVHYVLPDGYRGYFWVIVDRRAGVDVPVENGRATLRIPPDGVLYVQDDWFFSRWHKVTASDYSGNRIAGGTDDIYDPATVVVAGLNVSHESAPTYERLVHYHIVGTSDEIDRYYKSDGEAAREALDQRLAERRNQTTGGRVE